MGKCRLEREMQQVAEAPQQGPACCWDARGQEGRKSLRPHCEWELVRHALPYIYTLGGQQRDPRDLVSGPLSSHAAAMVRGLLLLSGQLEGLLEALSQSYPSWVCLSANSLWGAPCPTLPPSEGGVLEDGSPLPFCQVSRVRRLVTPLGGAPK